MENEIRYTVPFTPLEERIAQEAPHLLTGLKRLKEEIGTEEFEKYFNTLVSLRKVDELVLIITKREMNRSIIVSRYLPAVKKCFSAAVVQVINQ